MNAMSELPEKLLATVQELRSHLREFPDAQAGFKSIRSHWLTRQLFPPDDELLHKALNVLVNAGELEVVRQSGELQFRAAGARWSLVDEPG